MTKPYIVERPIAGHTWYVVCGRFATAHMAKQAWERIERKVPRGSLGIYRHGWEDKPGVLVSGIGLDSDQVARVAGFLTLAEHEPLSDEVMDAMIARRASVVVDAAASGYPDGRLKWRRPGGGAQLRSDGQMIEPEPGQG